MRLRPTADPLDDPRESLRRLYAYVSYRIGPGADAEDVVSSTVERALRYRASFDPRRGSAHSWLFGIANRCLADRAERRARAGPSTDAGDGEASAEDFAARSDVRLDLARALGDLDARSRELLALRFGGGLSSAEISELTALKPGTVDVAIHRALAQLRELLDSGGTGDTRHALPAAAAPDTPTRREPSPRTYAP